MWDLIVSVPDHCLSFYFVTFFPIFFFFFFFFFILFISSSLHVMVWRSLYLYINVCCVILYTKTSL